MPLEPPPRIVDKFNIIWRDWLYYFWEFVSEHTGGASPVPPATGTSWNAHGNTATGDATNQLWVDYGTFVVGQDNDNSPSGNTPEFFDSALSGDSGKVTAMAFIPAKGAFRVGGLLGKGWQDQWADALIGDYSIAGGQDVSATVPNAITFGRACSNEGTGASILMGDGSTVWSGSSRCVVIGGASEAGDSIGTATLFGTAIGGTNVVNGTYPVAVGLFTSSGTTTSSQTLTMGLNLTALGANNCFTVGIGLDSANKLTNTVSNSMYMGVGSTIPTIIMRNYSPGIGTTSFVGIVEDTPLSTLDVGGSVGYKYSILTGTSHTVGAADDELTFLVKPDGAFTFTLPPISGIDRRMYHIKNTSTLLRTVSVTPDGGGDFIDSGLVGVPPSATPLAVGRSSSVQLVADGTTSPATWWII